MVSSLSLILKMCEETSVMRKQILLLPLAGLAVALVIACAPDKPVVGIADAYVPYDAPTQIVGGISTPQAGSRNGNQQSPYATAVVKQPLPVSPTYSQQQSANARRVSAASLYGQVKVRKDYIPYRARGRTRRAMIPRYITIHSTQNWSRGADANRHALALKNSKLGRISWHYTTDDARAVQHLPTSEQGNHADYDGPGNKYSIGIEMCEHPGNSRKITVERTAKLAAWLMYKHDLPLSRVVPHYKWPRWGKRPPNKNCPHFLMTNGRPGAKWQGFLKKVSYYHNQIRG